MSWKARSKYIRGTKIALIAVCCTPFISKKLMGFSPYSFDNLNR